MADMLAAPFVLLDDARRERAAPARLYRAPVEVITATRADAVGGLLDTIADWQRAGSHVAGFLTYDAGAAIAGVAAHGAQPGDWPLGWFARFDRVERIDAADVPALLPDPAGAVLAAPRPAIDEAAYGKAITRVLDHIVAGDIYQANLTFATAVAVHGSPLAAYARLRARAAGGYGGVVWTGTHWLLSFSPELFFGLREGRIIARPMKGTAPRFADPAADRAAAATLASDAKQRAENLMIVDLIRNDLSRVAVAGSVHVPHLFRVETYPTVHQMVSDVTAEVRPGLGAVDVLRAAFPCGSITGAPKISAMRIIDALEASPRGPYTGSIGFLAPDGEAAFNVAIRTLALRAGEEVATLGLGSGIVADSRVDDEWRECLTKGDFVQAGAADFDLIETMAFDPRAGVALLERHLARLGASAHLLGFAFDRHAIRNSLQHATFLERGPARVRLRLSRRGALAVAVDAMPPALVEPVGCRLVPLPVAADDVRLAHKTSSRAFLDEARRAAGCDEIIFVDPEGRLTEGSYTSIFVERDGRLLTPPLARGLLSGVLRAELIGEGRAVEADLTRDDLRDGFWIGNALRGLMRATLLP